MQKPRDELRQETIDLRHRIEREDARRVAEGMCKAVADLRFEWGGREFRIGASIGFVMIDGRVTTVAEVLREADHACYSVKRDGRGQVAEYSVLAADRA